MIGDRGLTMYHVADLARNAVNGRFRALRLQEADRDCLYAMARATILSRAIEDRWISHDLDRDQ